MVLLFVGPALCAAAVVLAVIPTRYDPRCPERQRRHWPLVGGLFAGGVVADLILRPVVRLVPVLRPLAFIAPPAVPPVLYVLLAAVFGGLAVDEAAVRSRRELARRPLSAPAVVSLATPSRELPGTTDVTVAYSPDGNARATVLVRNAAPPIPTEGQSWPGGVRFSNAAGDGAVAREPPVLWDDVVVLTFLAAAALGMWMRGRSGGGGGAADADGDGDADSEQ